MACERLGIDEPWQEGPDAGARAAHQLVNKSLAVLGTAVHHEQLKLHETPKVHLELRVAPAGAFAHETAAKSKIAPVDALLLRSLCHQLVDQAEQTPCLWRQLVEASAQDFMSEAVRESDVLARHLDVPEHLAPVFVLLHFALVTVRIKVKYLGKSRRVRV